MDYYDLNANQEAEEEGQVQSSKRVRTDTLSIKKMYLIVNKRTDYLVGDFWDHFLEYLF